MRLLAGRLEDAMMRHHGSKRRLCCFPTTNFIKLDSQQTRTSTRLDAKALLIGLLMLKNACVGSFWRWSRYAHIFGAMKFNTINVVVFDFCTQAFPSLLLGAYRTLLPPSFR